MIAIHLDFCHLAQALCHNQQQIVPKVPYSSRKTEKGWIQDINKHNLMAKHLYRNCKKNNWLEDKSNEAVVALRTFQGGYIIFPPEDRDEKYETAIKGLNVEVSHLKARLTVGLYPS